VIATYHNEEGLNGMIYNRCIGTRYCANNCPYKVRRFNYFDNQILRWPDPMRLQLNPDVTVRAQGVMEKCTFCVQRIQSARDRGAGRRAGGGPGVKTAPAELPGAAIAFGDGGDRRSGRRAEPRAFQVLAELEVGPASPTARVRNRGARRAPSQSPTEATREAPRLDPRRAAGLWPAGRRPLVLGLTTAR
jgi:molybdopterin-containing oxidoreductase family iron-sulfur binding subunit